MPYAGLEYSTECYCGKEAPPYEKLPESSCMQPCGGSTFEKCGGSLALSVYYDSNVRRER
jgi:protein xylosyltransferase